MISKRFEVKRELIRRIHEEELLGEEDKIIEEKIEELVQNATKKIKDVDEKIKNNDYNECNKINHDKMVLENRKMILENKIALLELFKDCVKMDKQYFDYTNNNNLILEKIIKEIYKDETISQDTKEKLTEVTKKLKPNKFSLSIGLAKAEWYLKKKLD